MRKILVAVDLQNDFIDGSLTVPGAADVIPVINASKHEYDLVYFTADWHSTAHCSFKEQGGPWPVHCVHHTVGAAIPDSVIKDMDEGKMRVFHKGHLVEQYGAFAGLDPANQDWFCPGDEVTVCGIACEYCVLETLKNIQTLAETVKFKVRLWLSATAKFESYKPILDFAGEHGLEVVQ